MSLSFTSSMDFAPKFRMLSRSFSENSTQLAHGMDAGALQAVVGADGKVQVLDLLVQLGVGLLTLGREDGRQPRPPPLLRRMPDRPKTRPCTG